MTAGRRVSFWAIYSTVLAFKKGWNHFLFLLICMQIHTALIPCVSAVVVVVVAAVVVGGLQNAKDFLKRSLSASHLLWKSKNFAWICVKRWERLHVKCRFLVFCIRALPTTNDSWSNHEGLDPLSYRCVYWIMRIQGWWGVEGSVSASRSIFGFFFFFFRQAQSLRNLDGNILRSFFRTIS